MLKIIILLLLILSLGGASFFMFTEIGENNDISDAIATSSGEISEGTESEKKEENIIENRDEVVQSKIEKIRKRLALKGLIIEGDTYLQEGKKTLALKNFLDAYKQNPQDSLVIEKIGDTYFSMHRYASAIKYYEKLTQTPEAYILSLIYDIDTNSQDAITQAKQKIEALDIDEEAIFYYSNSILCVEDFHQCKLRFQDFFWGETSGQIENRNISFEPLRAIKRAIENYRAFQLDDTVLKNVYLLGAWHQHDMYSITNILGKNILDERSDYKAVLKIVAQSYFSLGEYDAARKYLNTFMEIDDDDPHVNYMIGIISSTLRDFLVSNIHLRKSIELGYQPSIEARRILIHNFYTLENTPAYLKEFRALIENEENYSENDLQLAIYHHILHGEYDWAIEATRKGKKKFPQNAYLYGYEGWIMKELGNIEDSIAVLEAGLNIDEENPFILLNLGYTYLEKSPSGALIFFKKTIAAATGSEFALQAQQEITNIRSGVSSN